MKALRRLFMAFLLIGGGFIATQAVTDADAVPIIDRTDNKSRDYAGYPKWGATSVKFSPNTVSQTSGALAVGFYRVHTNYKVWCDAVLGAQNPGKTATIAASRPIVAELPEPLYIDGRTDTKLACIASSGSATVTISPDTYTP